MRRLLIGVTVGDPAGIGPEVVCKAALDPSVMEAANLVVIGPIVALERALQASQGGLMVEPVSETDLRAGAANERRLLVLDPDVRGADEIVVGEASAAGGLCAFEALRTATRLALDDRLDAIATAPWNKEALALAGYAQTGHTEILAELTGVDRDDVAMMLTHDRLRVFHVSTHVPLSAVPGLLTATRLQTVTRLAHRTLRDDLGIVEPRIAVAGLNPHAGENGLFGGEEDSVVAPVIQELQAEGMSVTGPVPGDTVFWRALAGAYDGVIAMYHDQGHIPVKVAGRGHGVNVTVGLPIIRTSVDHGTAFDIAGQGVAEPTSMVAAIRYAAALATRRRASLRDVARDAPIRQTGRAG